MRVEELLIEEGSGLSGKSVAEARGSATALALRNSEGAVTTSPEDAMVLKPGDLLLTLGEES